MIIISVIIAVAVAVTVASQVLLLVTWALRGLLCVIRLFF